MNKENLKEVGNISDTYKKIIDSLIANHEEVPTFFCKEDEIFNQASNYLKRKADILEFLMHLRGKSYAYRYNKVSMKADNAVRQILLARGYYKKNINP